jgi:hypothetical protein
VTLHTYKQDETLGGVGGMWNVEQISEVQEMHLTFKQQHWLCGMGVQLSAHQVIVGGPHNCKLLY